jgi:hypothetical protein
MTLTSKSLAITILVILFGGILFSSAIGWWLTESSKQAAIFTDGEFAGQPNPADIRGSYTFGDVENNFDVPATTLAQAFRVSSADPSTFAVKDLETIYANEEFEIGTASVRLFVALYTGLPFEIQPDTYLPNRAVEMLKSHVTLTVEQVTYLDSHAIVLDPSDTAQSPPEPAPIAQTEEHIETDSTEDQTIKGKTTFQEVLDWGVPQETIEKIIGDPMPNPLTKVKDYCTEKGLSFEVIKSAIQEEINNLAP